MKQQSDRTIEDFTNFAIRDNVPHQVLNCAKFSMRVRTNRELHLIPFRCEAVERLAGREGARARIGPPSKETVKFRQEQGPAGRSIDRRHWPATRVSAAAAFESQMVLQAVSDQRRENVSSKIR